MLQKKINLPEQALLVHVKLSNSSYDNCANSEEFKELAKSSDIKILDLITYNINKQIGVKYLLSKGKLENLMSLVSRQQISLVIFNYELSASQQKNLEKFLDCKVLDRTELILYIFAKRARTFEGKLQVELARLKHLSTRLVRVWTHLERQRGGLGLRSGPGEQQIEIDRRIIKRKIKTITKNLEKIKQQRNLYRICRQKSMSTVISLVGYTNSGKSTLFNALTNSKVAAINMPFVTLDPTLRSLFIPRVGQVILADTVGFIRDLPHHLIDAFKATLEEINSSDLLLHVIDVSDNNSIDRKRQVLQVLKQIGAIDIPILEVYNKVDLRKSAFDELNGGLNLDATNCGVQISALHKKGIENLILEISNSICTELVNCTIKLIPKDANIRVELLNLCAIKNEVMDPITGEFQLDITIQKQLWDRLCNKFIDLSKMVVT